MINDPGQTTSLNEKMPAVAAELSRAVSAWRSEMFGSDSNARGKQQARGNSVDPRPIPVGFPEFPVTMLPARDGEPRGGVKRSSSAPNCSYFVNWRSPEDSMVWLLDVETAGTYSVEIDYTCPIPDAGATIELSFQGNQITGKVAPGWDPPLYTNQDTLPRPPAESQMKEFKTLHLGKIKLERGRGPLTLRALKIPGSQVMDVRRITLALQP
jgi:hypothetical protein